MASQGSRSTSVIAACATTPIARLIPGRDRSANIADVPQFRVSIGYASIAAEGR